MLSAIEPPSQVKRPVWLDRLGIRSRDADADVGAFVREHWPHAYRAAYLLLHDQQRAEDVAQETVLAALENSQCLDPNRPLRRWVERVATNRALDLLRSADARRTVASGGSESFTAATMGIETTTDPALSIALGALASEDRAAVVLRYVLGHGVPEVAGFLSISEGATRTRLHRALRRLRQQLEGATDAGD